MTPAWLNSTPFAVFDLETTGTDPATARIVQVAVLSVVDGEIADEWSQLVFPERPIPEESSLVHGITDKDVINAPHWSEVAAEFFGRISKAGLVGYNATHYDWPIVARESGGATHRQVLDVMAVVKQVDRRVRGKNKYRLTKAAARWGVPEYKAHDALGDCRSTWGLLKAIAGHSMHAGQPLREFVRRTHIDGVQQRKEFNEWLSAQATLETRDGE